MRNLLLTALLSAAACEHGRGGRGDDGYPSDWSPAMKAESARAERYCKAKVGDGTFLDWKECLAADEANQHCKSSFPAEAVQGCIWLNEHPVEADCKLQTQTDDSYWKCVEIGHERRDRIQDRQQLDAARREEAAERKRERKRQRRKELSDDLQKAFQPTDRNERECVTEETFGGKVKTTCRDR